MKSRISRWRAVIWVSAMRSIVRAFARRCQTPVRTQVVADGLDNEHPFVVQLFGVQLFAVRIVRSPRSPRFGSPPTMSFPPIADLDPHRGARMTIALAPTGPYVTSRRAPAAPPCPRTGAAGCSPPGSSSGCSPSAASRPTTCWLAPEACLPPPPEPCRHPSTSSSWSPGPATRCGRSPSGSTATIGVRPVPRRPDQPQRRAVDPGRPSDHAAVDRLSGARSGSSRRASHRHRRARVFRRGYAGGRVLPGLPG